MAVLHCDDFTKHDTITFFNLPQQEFQVLSEVVSISFPILFSENGLGKS